MTNHVEIPDQAAHDMIVSQVATSVSGFLGYLHAVNRARFGTGDEEYGDANALIEGTVAGLLRFMMDGPGSDEVITKLIADNVAHLLPQIRVSTMQVQGNA